MNSQPFGSSPEEEKQRRVFVATFSMLAKLASADGTITKREVEAVDAFMTKVLGLDDARRKYAIGVFNEARKSERDFREFAEEYRSLVDSKQEVLEWMLDILIRISLADRVFNTPESRLLSIACEAFGIDDSRFIELQKRYGAAADTSHYSALGCTPRSTDEEIENRYSTLCREYDPLRITTLSLPEEFVRLAKKRTEEFKAAYERIRRERGS